MHGWNTVVGLRIAAVEVLVMGIYFMHLRWSEPMVRLVGIAALMWLSILLAGTLDDLLTRGWLAVPGSESGSFQEWRVSRTGRAT